MGIPVALFYTTFGVSISEIGIGYIDLLTRFLLGTVVTLFAFGVITFLATYALGLLHTVTAIGSLQSGKEILRGRGFWELDDEEYGKWCSLLKKNNEKFPSLKKWGTPYEERIATRSELREFWRNSQSANFEIGRKAFTQIVNEKLGMSSLNAMGFIGDEILSRSRRVILRTLPVASLVVLTFMTTTAFLEADQLRSGNADFLLKSGFFGYGATPVNLSPAQESGLGVHDDGTLFLLGGSGANDLPLRPEKGRRSTYLRRSQTSGSSATARP